MAQQTHQHIVKTSPNYLPNKTSHCNDGTDPSKIPLHKLQLKKTKPTKQARKLHGELCAGVPEGTAQNSSGAGTTLEEWKTFTQYGQIIRES